MTMPMPSAATTMPRTMTGPEIDEQRRRLTAMLTLDRSRGVDGTVTLDRMRRLLAEQGYDADHGMAALIADTTVTAAAPDATGRPSTYRPKVRPPSPELLPLPETTFGRALGLMASGVLPLPAQTKATMGLPVPYGSTERAMTAVPQAVGTALSLYGAGRALQGLGVMPSVAKAMTAQPLAAGASAALGGAFAGSAELAEASPTDVAVMEAVGGFLPTAAQLLIKVPLQAAAAGLSRAARDEMAQGIAGARSIGISQPTVGMVTGSGAGQSMEQFIERTPLGQPIRRAYKRASQEVGDFVDAAANALLNRTSPTSAVGAAVRASRALPTGRTAAGELMQTGIHASNARFTAWRDRAYTAFSQMMADEPVRVSNFSTMMTRLTALSKTDPAAAEIVEMVQPNFAAKMQARVDEALGPEQMKVVGADGAPLYTAPREGLSWRGADELRRALSQQMESSDLITDPGKKQHAEALYGAIMQDQRDAVEAFTRRTGVPMQAKWDRLRGIVKQYHQRLNQVNPLVREGVTPEQAFDVVMKAAKTDDLTALRRMLRAATPDGRKVFSAEMTRRMGLVAHDTGKDMPIWSVTNFSKAFLAMTPKVRQEVFGPALGPKLLEDMRKVAEIGERVGDVNPMLMSAKDILPPSATSAMLRNLTLVGVASGTALTALAQGHPAGYVPGTVFAGAGLAVTMLNNALAKRFSDPKFLSKLVRGVDMPTAGLPVLVDMIRRELDTEDQDDAALHQALPELMGVPDMQAMDRFRARPDQTVSRMP